MNIQAVVVNYRSSNYVRACLASLARAGVKRVCVVDNFSTQEERAAVEAIASAAPVETVFTPLADNFGFGVGVNRGVASLAASDDDLLWIVNPDAEVTPRALASLVRRFEDDAADIVSPLILTGTQLAPRVWFGGGSIREAEGRTIHQHYGKPADGLSGLASAEFLTGAAPIMRVGVFKELNGFREDLFLYWEDADFSRRAIAAGMRLAVDCDAQIWHAVGGSGDTSGKSAAYYYHMQRNRMLVAAPWTSRWNLLIGRGIIETVKLTFRPLKEPDARLQKFSASFRGLVSGFRNVSKGAL